MNLVWKPRDLGGVEDVRIPINQLFTRKDPILITICKDLLTPSESEKIKEQTKEDQRKNDKYQKKISLPLQLSLDVNEP